MLSTENPNDIAVFDVLFASAKCDDANGVAADGFCYAFNRNKIGEGVLVHDVIEIFGELGVGVWVDWSEIDGVDLSEVVFEGESVVGVCGALSFVVVFVVVDFLAIAGPSEAMFAVVSLGEYERFNSVAEHGLVFNEVDDVEAYFIMLFCVVYFEVKPLVVSFCVDVILEDEVVCLDLWGLFSVDV